MQSPANVSDAEQVQMLADPNRLAILRRLMAQTATITQLGVVMNRHPAWIRHHVKRLEGAGLVRLAEERTTRNYTERFYEATASAFTVHLLVTPDTGAARSLIALGSDDYALRALAGTMRAADEDSAFMPVAIGSLDGLIALRQGLADVAGCHLLDPETDRYNVDYVRHLFPDTPALIVTLADRQQGLFVAPGNPLGITSIDDLARGGVRSALRNRGSGTRVWLDRALSARGIPLDALEHEADALTHAQAADAVACGRADAALGVEQAATDAGLDFVPLFTERFDLVVLVERSEDPVVARLLDSVAAKRFRQSVGHLRGYDNSSTGCEQRLAV